MKTKLWLGLAVLGAGYVVFLLLVQWTASESQSHISVASDSLFPAALSSQEADAAFQRMIKRYNDAILLQDKTALSKADADAEEVATALKTTKDKTSSEPKLQAQVDALLVQFSEIQNRSKSTYGAMIDAKDNVSDSVMSAVGSLAKDNKQIDVGLKQLRSDISKEFETELQSVSAWSRRQRTFGLLLFVVVMLCAVGVARFNQQSIERPLRNLAARIRDIAEGDGDLTRRLEITTKDEIGAVSSSFNDLMDKLQTIMLRIAANTSRLAQSSAALSESASTLAADAETQSSQATMITNAMQEMSATVVSVSDNSHQATDGAQQAGELAKRGGKTVDSAVKVILDVAESTRATAATIESLGKRSDQIGNIIGVIDDIADQTNLLALNAAIEAARAGEQGRGFAVVADEVRKLAERTSTATKEIAQTVRTIQDETRNAVQAMQVGTTKVDAGVNSAREAGLALEQIIESAERVQDMITRIATAATEQASTTEQVSSNMEQIAQLVGKSASGAQESARASSELSALALDLQESIGRFKLGSDDQLSQLEVNSTSSLERPAMPPRPQSRYSRLLQ